ncbi:MAG: hypothetical protein EBY32_09795 [Proteobacteria bacterium]|jgi:hypothetical protein|nr:hypothetical protein [Pseudomonadota bacterium]
MRALTARILIRHQGQRLEKFLAGASLKKSSCKKLNEVAVSLTSWGPRLGILPFALLSLLEQMQKPNGIFVWLAKGDLDLLAPRIRERFQAEGVFFESCDDLGPHTKWLPMIEAGYSAPFVICDDDVLYPTNWLGSLLDEDRVDAYTGTRCHQIALENGSLLQYELWKKDIGWTGNTSPLTFLTACGGGVLHPERIPKSFLSREQIRRKCPKADDIWLHAAHLKAGVPIYKTQFSFPCLEIPGSEVSGLLRQNVDAGGNDAQLDILRKVFFTSYRQARCA